MKIVGINSHPSGSTKTIMCSILDFAETEGDMITYAFWGNWKSKNIEKPNRKHFGYYLENTLNAAFSRCTGLHGFGSIIGTVLLVKELKKIHPDIIHLHNLHLWSINIPILIRYIKSNDISIVWTLHDCWPLTGHCTHFLQNGCEKWKTGCHNCDNHKSYPYAYVDMTRYMWKKKKEWFSNLPNATIVVPSHWLASIVKDSFLNEYKTIVINNGINTYKFKPTPSNFREKYNIGDRFLILGVAFSWGEQKGLDQFIKLHDGLDPNVYSIVLVGTTDEIDKLLPQGIISIHRTQSQEELAEIYSASDIFLNPTREDNFPTTNIEALACGTPVITSDVGGCAEIITDDCGKSIKVNQFDELPSIIEQIRINRPFHSSSCLKRAADFNSKDKYIEYIKLYKEIILEEK